MILSLLRFFLIAFLGQTQAASLMSRQRRGGWYDWWNPAVLAGEGQPHRVGSLLCPFVALWGGWHTGGVPVKPLWSCCESYPSGDIFCLTHPTLRESENPAVNFKFLYSWTFLPATGRQASPSDSDVLRTALMPSHSPCQVFLLITFAVPRSLSQRQGRVEWGWRSEFAGSPGHWLL